MLKQNYKVYKGQGYLRLQFDTKNTDMASGNTVTAVINYRKPSGATGNWTATIDGTLVKKQLSNEDIDEDGEWTFQPVVTVDGLVGPCDTATITFTLKLLDE